MESIYNVFYNLSSTKLNLAVVVLSRVLPVNKNYNKIQRKSCLAEIIALFYFYEKYMEQFHWLICSFDFFSHGGVAICCTCPGVAYVDNVTRDSEERI